MRFRRSLPSLLPRFFVPMAGALVLVAAAETLGRASGPTPASFSTTVGNSCDRLSMKKVGSGTWVLFEGKTYLLTALHVLTQPDACVWVNGGPQAAAVERANITCDLALLTLKDAKLQGTIVPTNIRHAADTWSLWTFSAHTGSEQSFAAADKTKVGSNTLVLIPDPQNTSVSNQSKPLFASSAEPFDLLKLTREGLRLGWGDSGAGVFSGTDLAGVVVAHGLHPKSTASNKVVWGYAIPDYEILRSSRWQNASPQSSLPPPLLQTGVGSAMIALQSEVFWRFARPADGCVAYQKLLASLEELERDSFWATVDNSRGPVVPTLDADVSEKAVEDSNAAVHGLSACGWRAEVGELLRPFVQLKALERRLGTLQTLWSSLHEAIVFPAGDPSAPPSWRGWESLDVPTDPGKNTKSATKKTWLNPLETLLSASPSIASSPAADLGAQWKLVLGALESAGQSWGGKLASSLWPSASTTNVTEIQTIEKALGAVFSAAGKGATLRTLLRDPISRAQIWKNLADSGLISAGALVDYATQVSFEVLDARQQAIATPSVAGAAVTSSPLAASAAPTSNANAGPGAPEPGVPAIVAAPTATSTPAAASAAPPSILSYSLDKVDFYSKIFSMSGKVPWTGARIHAAVSEAHALDLDYNGLPQRLREATSVDDVFAAFVADSTDLADAFEQQQSGGETRLSAKLKVAREQARTLEKALGNAIIELMEEPACLGAKPSMSAVAAASCKPITPASGASSAPADSSTPVTPPVSTATTSPP